MNRHLLLALIMIAVAPLARAAAAPAADTLDSGTLALWLFDEPEYLNMTLTDATRRQFDLRKMPGGTLVPGRFGNAFEIIGPGPAVRFAGPTNLLLADCELSNKQIPPAEYLRQHAGIPEVLNLGYLDWTIETWLRVPEGHALEGTLWQLAGAPIGPGCPYGLNTLRFEQRDGKPHLVLLGNYGSDTLKDFPRYQVAIPMATDARLADGGWHHLAISFAAGERQTRVFVDGRLQALPAAGSWLPLTNTIVSLTLGHDHDGGNRLAVQLDEFRVSHVCRYRADFDLPGSFSRWSGHKPEVAAVPPGLLFTNQAPVTMPIQLEGRRHVLIDGALFARREGIEFKVNPPASVELTDFRITDRWEVGPRFGPGMPDILHFYDNGDELRLVYTNGGMWGGKRDAICLATSRDGLHWAKPALGIVDYDGSRENNILMTDATQGTMFKDPNPATPAAARYKYFAYQMQRGLYVYTSPDGIDWRRNETIGAPFDCGGGVETFYDDQRASYMTYIRHEGFLVGAGTGRACALAEARNPLAPWPFSPATQPRPRIGFFDLPSITTELPVPIAPDNQGEIYRSKAVKYAGAPDTYLAFPWKYTKKGNVRAGTHLMTSRDGVTWTTYTQPIYFSNDREVEGRPVVEALIDHGVVRRGDELLQVATVRFTGHGGAAYGGEENEGGIHDRLMLLRQRLDGYTAASAEATTGTLESLPLVYEGGALRLNLRLAEGGALRVTLIDEAGQEYHGRASAADGINVPVAFEDAGVVARLAGSPVRLRLELSRGQLFALQFGQP